MCSNYPGIKLEPTFETLEDKIEHLSSCAYVVHTTANKSFHVVERRRTSSKCQKMKNARAKRAKILFFIVKYANLWVFSCRRRRGYLSSLISVLHARHALMNKSVSSSENITPNYLIYSFDDNFSIKPQISNSLYLI